ncbi:MAG TPA: DUF481 domain-containing protein [Gemmatimonadaceae bacterium]|nr:DUF481 domain-containing protein [Gemmatimonadaceae bacterium]
MTSTRSPFREPMYPTSTCYRATIAALTVVVVLGTLVPAAAAQDVLEPAITKATIDFGFVQTSGNTAVTTLNVGERFSRERGRFTLSQAFAMVYGKQGDTVSTNNLRTTLRGDYKIDRVLAVFLGGGFDRNRFAGIERRFEEQFGLQARVLAMSKDTINLEGGGSVTQQISTDGEQRNFPSARGAISWRHSFTATSYFDQQVEWVPNLSETKDWRVNLESSIVAPLSARIGVKLSWVLRYDNLPQPGFSDTDRFFTTGVQITYD